MAAEQPRRGPRPGSDKPRSGGKRDDKPRSGSGARRDDKPRSGSGARRDEKPRSGSGARRDEKPRSGSPRRDDRRGAGANQRRDDRSSGRPPRAESGAVTERPPDPIVDEDITGHELDDEVREALGSLSGGAAAAVSRHLVMAARLLDEDPDQAYEHAMAARRRAARIGVVREAVGVAAYAAGRYTEALAELRTARRLTGSAEYLPMMADSERGLGRPRRALDLAADPAVTSLDTAGRIEMLIVAAGARRDLGEVDAAAVALQVPELRSRSREPWVARLRYAYADNLEAAGRTGEAQRWFLRAAEADPDGATDAEDRAHAIRVDES